MWPYFLVAGVIGLGAVFFGKKKAPTTALPPAPKTAPVAAKPITKTVAAVVPAVSSKGMTVIVPPPAPVAQIPGQAPIVTFNFAELDPTKLDLLAATGQAIVDGGLAGFENGAAVLANRNQALTFRLNRTTYNDPVSLTSYPKNWTETMTLGDDRNGYDRSKFKRGFDIGLAACQGQTTDSDEQNSVRILLNDRDSFLGFDVAQQFQWARSAYRAKSTGVEDFAAAYAAALAKESQ